MLLLGQAVLRALTCLLSFDCVPVHDLPSLVEAALFRLQPRHRALSIDSVDAVKFYQNLAVFLRKIFLVCPLSLLEAYAQSLLAIFVTDISSLPFPLLSCLTEVSELILRGLPHFHRFLHFLFRGFERQELHSQLSRIFRFVLLDHLDVVPLLLRDLSVDLAVDSAPEDTCAMGACGSDETAASKRSKVEWSGPTSLSALPVLAEAVGDNDSFVNHLASIFVEIARAALSDGSVNIYRTRSALSIFVGVPGLSFLVSLLAQRVLDHMQQMRALSLQLEMQVEPSPSSVSELQQLIDCYLAMGYDLLPFGSTEELKPLMQQLQTVITIPWQLCASSLIVSRRPDVAAGPALIFSEQTYRSTLSLICQLPLVDWDAACHLFTAGLSQPNESLRQCTLGSLALFLARLKCRQEHLFQSFSASIFKMIRCV